MGFPRRNLGSVQMTTDTAVRVTKLIIENGKSFNDIEFVDRPEISSNEKECLILNFRFVKSQDGTPLIADSIRDLLLIDDDFVIESLE